MKAIVIDDGSQGPTLRLTDAPVPTPAPGEILIRVRAAGVNRADLVRAKSHFGMDRPQEFAIAGMEVAGEVEACGEGADRFRPGDRIIAMAPRSYAEYCIVHQEIASPAPPNFDWPEALASCTSFITAHNALVTAAALQPGETVLVQGAAASAGIATVQLAAYLGAPIIAGTSGKPAKLDRLKQLGLTAPFTRVTDSSIAAALQVTAGKGFNVIIDNVGSGALDFNIRVAAVLGRIVSVGRLGGNRDMLEIDELARKRLSLIGVTFRTRSRQEHAAVVRAYEREVMPAFASGALRPVVDRVFPLEEASAAQAYMAEDTHFGKVLLSVF